MYLTLITITSALYIYLTWQNPKLGLFLLAAALPSYLLRFEIFGLPTTLLEILIVIFLIIWIIKYPEVRPQPTLIRSNLAKWLLPISTLLIAATISLFVSPDRLSALGVWKAYFIEPILIFVALTTLIKTKEDQNKLIDFLGFGALFISIIAVFQFITGFGIPIPWDFERRVTSVFPYPNAIGLYLGPIFILGLSRLSSPLFKGGYRGVMLWKFTLPFSLIAIMLAKSEASLVAIVATSLILGLISSKWRRYTILIIAGLALIISFYQPLQDKLFLNDYSGNIRRVQWEETINLIKDKPVFGAGLSGYPIEIKPYHTHPEIEIFQYPHNIILNIWVELGLLGLIAFFLLIKTLIKSTPLHPVLYKAKPGLASDPPDKSLLHILYLFPLLHMAIHGLVDVPYFKNDLAVLTWIIIGLIEVSYGTRKKTENQS